MRCSRGSTVTARVEDTAVHAASVGLLAKVRALIALITAAGRERLRSVYRKGFLLRADEDGG